MIEAKAGGEEGDSIDSQEIGAVVQAEVGE